MRITSRKRAYAHLCRALAGVIFALSGLAVPAAHAALNLSINPTDGGNSIRFGRIDSPTAIDAEVRVRITASDNQQYQLFQRFEEPFTNERGEQLDRQVVETSALIGSNGSGTLYVEDPQRMNFAEQLIYTSSPEGMSDAFTLVYHVDPREITKSGNFSGRILYTVRPVGGGQSEEVIINAYLDAQQEDVRLDIRSDSGQGQLVLHTASDREREASIEISYRGNRGPLRIYQQIEQFPTNEEGRSLERETIRFSVAGEQGGETDYVVPTEFNQRRVLLYEGEAAEDAVVIRYALNDEGQFAGTYRGMMSLVVEGEGINDIRPFEMTVDIAPVFELSAEYPPGGMSFSKLQPDSPPQTREIVVTVHTNLGKAYEVVQQVSGQMTNEQGEMIDPQYFTMSQELLPDGKGDVQFEEFAPVESGDVTIFRSDRHGSPAKFKVVYRLRTYPQMPAGHYRTAVVYSLNEV